MKRLWTMLVVLIVGVGSTVECGCFAAERSALQDKPAHVRELIRTINDQPDPLHWDYTASVLALIHEGEPALLPVLEVPYSGDYFTRTRICSAAEGILQTMYGWELGRGWKDRAREKEFRSLLKQLGELDPESTPDAWKQTIARWQKWAQARVREK
jgi:hypothetical protein